MRPSLKFVLLSTLGLATAFACSQSNDDDDDAAGTGGVPALMGTGGDPAGAAAATGAGNASSQATGGDANAQAPCPNLDLGDSCVADQKNAEPQPVNMLVVLDKSGSMGSQGLGSGAKWDAMKSALTGAFGAAKGNANLNMGLLLFPGQAVASDCSMQGPEPCCEIPSGEAAVNVKLAPAAQSVDQILDVVNNTAPGGLTPTSVALDAAYAYFQGEGSLLQGDKYILLATDGGPNCNGALACGDAECTLNLDGNCGEGENCCDSNTGPYWCVNHAETAAKIEGLRQLGVKTIVVGIPGSEAYADWLDNFAQAGGAVAEGGTRLYYEVSASAGVAGLTKTFEDITIKLVRTCDIQLSENPPMADEFLINVALNCVVVPRGSSSDEAGPNWEIDATTSPPTLHIYGKYCEQIQAGVERLDIVVGCPPTL